MIKKTKRAKSISGTTERPRLAVYKGLKNMYAQIIDDTKGITLAAASSIDKAFTKDQKVKNVGVEACKKIGTLIAEKAKAKGILKVVFDRRDKQYHGKVKAIAEGAREGGLIF
jgi:large subunit ribosomal protein L18